MSGVERIERALGLLIGTVAAVVVLLASFFILFGRDLPSGLFPVVITVTLVLAVIPGATAGVRLTVGVSAVERDRSDGLDTSAVVSRSIWSGIIVNAVFAGLGMVASMGMLMAALIPYVVIGSALVAAVAGLLGWGAARLVARKLTRH